MDIITLGVAIVTGIYLVVSILFFRKLSDNYEFFERRGFLTIVVSLILFGISVYCLFGDISIIEFIGNASKNRVRILK